MSERQRANVSAARRARGIAEMPNPLAGCRSCQVIGGCVGALSPVVAGVRKLGRSARCAVRSGRSAHADLCDLDTVGGSSGVVRAAVKAKGRVPS